MCGHFSGCLGAGCSGVTSLVSGGWLALCWMMEGYWGTSHHSWSKFLLVHMAVALREVVETCKVSWGLHLELMQRHFCHVLLAKISHEARQDSRCGEMNSASWWEWAAVSHCRSMDTRRGRELGSFYNHSDLAQVSSSLWICFLTCKNG